LQAIDYAECADKLSPATKEMYTTIRKIFPRFVDDKPRYRELEKVKNHFLQNNIGFFEAHPAAQVAVH
jgi:histidine ammonia-lyase